MEKESCSRNRRIEVLIVEDDPRIAEINRRFTEKVEGFSVVGTASTGMEAKDWLEVLRPQLVLLDNYLPDVLGVDLIWHIRQHSRNTDVILVTAANETEVVQEALRGGVVDYIVKPIQFERFRCSLEQYRDQREQMKQNGRMDQYQIDQLWKGGSSLSESAKQAASPPSVPKGIDPITLKKVQRVLLEGGSQGWTAEEVAFQLGASRATARRYLEYLVSTGTLRADLSYGSVGRPERRYFFTSVRHLG